MSLQGQAAGNIRATLYSATITAAIAGVAQTPVIGITPCKMLVAEAQFVRGSGGTSVDVYIQTSIDGGVSWFDIINFHFLTTTANKISVAVMNPATPVPPATVPGSGALAADTVVNGILGDRFRALITTTGTYGGATTLRVDIVTKG